MQRSPQAFRVVGWRHLAASQRTGHFRSVPAGRASEWRRPDADRRQSISWALRARYNGQGACRKPDPRQRRARSLQQYWDMEGRVDSTGGPRTQWLYLAADFFYVRHRQSRSRPPLPGFRADPYQRLLLQLSNSRGSKAVPNSISCDER